jgi:hypothetical protein
MSKTFSIVAAGGLLAGLLAAGPIAMAADEGTTSGPAAGSTVKPGSAMKKGDMKGPADVNTEAAQGGVAAGAPGVAGQPGNKNGPPAKRTGGEKNTR